MRTKRILLASAVSVILVALTAASASAATSARPSGTSPSFQSVGNVAAPVVTPETPIGGGGWEYVNTSVGVPDGCGVMAIVANAIGDGEVQFQAQIVSGSGPLAGTAKVTYSGGSKTFDVIGTDWISDIVTIGGYHNGEKVGIVLNVNAVSTLEDCYLPEAEVVVTVTG
jgi:hypothetical protein